MDNMQAQMNAILENPDMMQKIMAMAQSLGQAPQQEPPPKPDTAAAPAFPEMDLSMLQKLSGLAGKSSIDSNQRSLLNALVPYLSRERLSKLERAMRAAKMAGLASTFLSGSGL